MKASSFRMETGIPDAVLYRERILGAQKERREMRRFVFITTYSNGWKDRKQKRVNVQERES